jgi:hypothetical protein
MNGRVSHAAINAPSNLSSRLVLNSWILQLGFWTNKIAIECNNILSMDYANRVDNQSLLEDINCGIFYLLYRHIALLPPYQVLKLINTSSILD